MMVSSDTKPTTKSSSSSSCFEKVKAFITYEPLPNTKLPVYLFFKNRYFRAVVYILFCLCTTLVYYGWQPFSMMLFRSGAYRWRCTDDELLDMGPDDYCPKQYDAVQTMFTVGLSSEFIVGVLAGICLDHIGPLATSIVGNVMLCIGWVFMMYSSATAELYIPGMIFLGGAINMICFPALGLADLFPSRSGLAVSIVVAAQTTATFVAPALKAIWDANRGWSYRQLIWGYLGIVVLPCFILTMLTVPVKRFCLTTAAAADGVGGGGIISDDDDAAARSLSECKTANVFEKDLPMIPEGDDEGSSSSGHKTTAVVVVDISISQTPDHLHHHHDQDDNHHHHHKPDAAAAVVVEQTFLQQIMSMEYLLFTLYYVAQLFQFGYYPTTVLKHFGDDVANFQGYILPTQGIWGTLFGLIVDKTGTLSICIGLITMMTGTYALALIPSTGLQYVSSILYVVSNSYIYTVKYTYVAELYPPTHYGVMIGLVGCVAGALTLLNIFVQNADEYVATCIAYIVVGFVAYTIVFFLLYRQKKKGVHYRVAPDNNNNNSHYHADGGGGVAEGVVKDNHHHDVHDGEIAVKEKVMTTDF